MFQNKIDLSWQRILDSINVNENIKNKVCLNSREVSQILGISQSSLEGYRRASIGPEYIKVDAGKRARIMYPKASIVDWISRNKILTN